MMIPTAPPSTSARGVAAAPRPSPMSKSRAGHSFKLARSPMGSGTTSMAPTATSTVTGEREP